MEDEFLTDEELVNLTNLKIIDSYRIYYKSDTGDIYSITNEVLPLDCESVEVEFELIEKFLTGKENFIFFRLEFDDEDAIKFVNKKEAPVLYKSNIIEYIRITQDKDPVLQVTWTQSGWEFKLDKKFADSPRGKNINSKLNFFVVRERDINYLVRSIEITLKKLLAQDTIFVEFEEEAERNNNDIAMFTLPFFRSYGMKING